MAIKLHISDDLALPIDAVTQAIGFLGRRGSGKSYAATKLAELLHEHGGQFVAIDPVGIWYGLRLSHDGKGKGLDVPIFGGLHGDIPLQAGAGAMLADVVVDRGLSAVLDVSQFESDADKAKFARDFAARFFYRKKAAPSAVHLFIEECQEFIPQNIQKGEEQMLHAFQRMIRLGRNYGIGVSMISQRPQDVNKKALNQTECLFCFQLTGPQERKAVEGWVSDKGLDDDLSRLLPELKVGNAHVWSPVWLNVNREVRIAAKTTFPAGTTPKVGAQPVKMKPLEPLELEQLHRDMAATIEQAKANDPAALKRRIAELEKQLRDRPSEQVERVVEKIIEVPVLRNGQLDRTEGLAERHERIAERFLAESAELRRLIAPASAPRPQLRPAPVQRVAVAVAPRPARSEAVRSEVGELPKGERAILTAVAQYDGGVSRKQLTVLTGYKRSTRDAYIQRLAERGHVAVAGDQIAPTDEGLAALGPDFEPLPTGDALREFWMGRLPEGERKLLEALVEHYPKAVPRETVGEATGFKRSTRDAYLQRMQSKRVIVNVGRGEVKAADELFG